jgi:hypothetical protein
MKRQSKQRGRLLLNALTVLSLVLALATLFVPPAEGLPMRDGALGVYRNGTAIVIAQTKKFEIWYPESFAEFRTFAPAWPVERRYTALGLGLRLNSPQLEAASGRSAERYCQSELSVSVLWLFLPALALMSRWLFWRRMSLPAGHCPACGYDMRANPARCSECGREMKKLST